MLPVAAAAAPWRVADPRRRVCHVHADHAAPARSFRAGSNGGVPPSVVERASSARPRSGRAAAVNKCGSRSPTSTGKCGGSRPPHPGHRDCQPGAPAGSTLWNSAAFGAARKSCNGCRGGTPGYPPLAGVVELRKFMTTGELGRGARRGRRRARRGRPRGRLVVCPLNKLTLDLRGVSTVRAGIAVRRPVRPRASNRKIISGTYH